MCPLTLFLDSLEFPSHLQCWNSHYLLWHPLRLLNSRHKPCCLARTVWGPRKQEKSRFTPLPGKFRERDNSLRKSLSWKTLLSSLLSEFLHRRRQISVPLLFTLPEFAEVIRAFWSFLSPLFFLFSLIWFDTKFPLYPDQNLRNLYLCAMFLKSCYVPSLPLLQNSIPVGLKFTYL